MPGNWDPAVYRARSRQWREAAEAMPAGETQDAYLRLSDDYAKLAELIALSGPTITGGGDPSA